MSINEAVDRSIKVLYMIHSRDDGAITVPELRDVLEAMREKPMTIEEVREMNGPLQTPDDPIWTQAEVKEKLKPMIECGGSNPCKTIEQTLKSFGIEP